MNAPMVRALTEEFCVTQALIIISGRGRSSCAMILFLSWICASSPGLVSEKTRRSGGVCVPDPMATATDCMASGALGAGVGAGEAGVPAGVAAAAGADPQGVAFPSASPATTQGVVSELIWMLLPAGWVT